MTTFIAAVATTAGELGFETVKLQEFITHAYARKLAREGDRDDGFSIKSLTADFRTRFLTCGIMFLEAFINNQKELMLH